MKFLGGPFMEKISGPKIVLSLILIHEFSAFFEISRQLTSASEPALYTSPVGARKEIRGEVFGWSFHEKNFGSQNCVIPDHNT